MSYSKFISKSTINSIKMKPLSLVSLFNSNNIIQKESVQVKEVKVVNPPHNTYSVIQINPFTLEERLIMFPSLEEDNTNKNNYLVIDVE